MMILFYMFVVLTGISALGILFIKNVFHAALLLLVCLISIAGIYIINFAELVAVTQILIYAGGIIILLIFGIMLTSRLSEKPLIVTNNRWAEGVLVGIPLLILLIIFLLRENFSQNSVHPFNAGQWNNINLIGISFMTDYLLPFEVAGILLLVALIGASAMAAYKQNEPDKK
jgi:NADH:ubiquinone oxidoreductase subunit 6 (subunit J)